MRVRSEPSMRQFSVFAGRAKHAWVVAFTWPFQVKEISVWVGTLVLC